MFKVVIFLAFVVAIAAQCTTNGACQTCKGTATICDSGVGTSCEKLTGSIPSDNFCNLNADDKYCSAAPASVYTEENFNAAKKAAEDAFQACKDNKDNIASCCVEGCTTSDCFCPTVCTGTKEESGEGTIPATGKKYCFEYCTSCDGVGKTETYCADNCNATSATWACKDDTDCCADFGSASVLSSFLSFFF
eukprot:TRINITY_DN19734_c0_g1_i1.p1 TRINITY_DN19734_c0_g1~~TRINITY_DN19734_c0_g1_i1.p1  ORF type:complete len:192 (+),score=37.29 TRINITY_DN19734_c0_g1_i1:98-673(+)